jgi:hypothetical protein
MRHPKNSHPKKLLVAVIAAICSVQTIAGKPQISHPSPARKSSIESKLAQKASFMPHSSSALEQLIEVARHYKIPMGIEWVEPPSGEGQVLALEQSATVRDLISAILSRQSTYRIEIEDGVLNISDSVAAADPRNLLNLRIPEFFVENRNLHQGQALLRIKMEMMLYPTEYQEGHISDSGVGPAYDVKKFSLSGRNLTVREILNKLTHASGNALWVVRLHYAQTTSGELPSLQNVRLGERQSTGLNRESAPPYAEGTADEIQESKEFRWEFIPRTETPAKTDYRVFSPSKKAQ